MQGAGSAQVRLDRPWASQVEALLPPWLMTGHRNRRLTQTMTRCLRTISCHANGGESARLLMPTGRENSPYNKFLLKINIPRGTGDVIFVFLIDLVHFTALVCVNANPWSNVFIYNITASPSLMWFLLFFYEIGGVWAPTKINIKKN